MYEETSAMAPAVVVAVVVVGGTRKESSGSKIPQATVAEAVKRVTTHIVLHEESLGDGKDHGLPNE